MHFDAITYSLLKDRKLRNVAPLCTIETSGWTGSQSGEVLFTGDGTTTDFSGKVDLPPVNPLDSFTLHYTIGGISYDATADSDGNITGTHIKSGTIINQDGTYEIYFDTPPDNGTDGMADYDHGIEPANLENMLDPNKPPTGWGWFSTPSAEYRAEMIIKFKQNGIYLVGFRYEIENRKSDGLYWRWIYKEINSPNWQHGVYNLYHFWLSGNSTALKAGIWHVVKDSGFRIYGHAEDACELRIRFHNFFVFKLG